MIEGDSFAVLISIQISEKSNARTPSRSKSVFKTNLSDVINHSKIENTECSLPCYINASNICGRKVGGIMDHVERMFLFLFVESSDDLRLNQFPVL